MRPDNTTYPTLWIQNVHGVLFPISTDLHAEAATATQVDPQSNRHSAVATDDDSVPSSQDSK